MTRTFYLKKLIKTVLFILSLHVGTLMAQGSLQFNQAVLVSTVQTVPANKVWKIESIMSDDTDAGTGGGKLLNAQVAIENTASTANNSSPRNQTAIYRYIAVNGANICADVSGLSATDTFWGSAVGVSAAAIPRYHLNLLNLPAWLPAGTTLAAGTNVTYISVIEFNIVP